MPIFLRPIAVTGPVAGWSSAYRRAYPPTIPVAPTMTRRAWLDGKAIITRAPLLPHYTVRGVSNSSRQAVLNSRIRLTELLLIISRSSMKLLFGSE
jgi:hypothetical protein